MTFEHSAPVNCDPYPYDEVSNMVSGRVALVDLDRHHREFASGDAFCAEVVWRHVGERRTVPEVLRRCSWSAFMSVASSHGRYGDPKAKAPITGSLTARS